MKEPDGKAVRFEDCPYRDAYNRCRCGKCKVCGFPKHTSVHGGIIGDTTGKPWGHAFVPIENDK